MGLRSEVEGLLAEFAEDFGNQDSASLANFRASPAVAADGSPRRA
jgi:hypothetical protein